MRSPRITFNTIVEILDLQAFLPKNILQSSKRMSLTFCFDVRSRFASGIMFLLALSACVSPSPASVMDSTASPIDVVSDAVEPEDASHSEVATADSLEDSALDSMGEPTVFEIGLRYEVSRKSAPSLEGELIAIYDHSLWWDVAEPRRTLAFFDATRFADFPEDRSLVFIDEDDIVSATPMSPAVPTFRDWLEAQALGFALPLEGPVYVMAGHERHHLAERGYGDFAYDLGHAEPDGTRWRGDGRDLEDYLSWDLPVLSPISGVIVEMVRDAPDEPPGGEPDLGLPENMVGLWLGGSYHAYLLHFRQGSILAELTVGSRVTLGDPLGDIGNSGTSLEPHLHLVLLYWDTERSRYWSVPVDFLNVRAGPSSETATIFERIAPRGGTFLWPP